MNPWYVNQRTWSMSCCGSDESSCEQEVPATRHLSCLTVSARCKSCSPAALHQHCTITCWLAGRKETDWCHNMANSGAEALCGTESNRNRNIGNTESARSGRGRAGHSTTLQDKTWAGASPGPKNRPHSACVRKHKHVHVAKGRERDVYCAGG